MLAAYSSDAEQQGTPSVPNPEASASLDAFAGDSLLSAVAAESSFTPEILRFLQTMSQTIQGLEPVAAGSLYRKMEELTIPIGKVLFRRGDTADDGMYVVISGELGLYAEDDIEIAGSRFSAFSPRQGQHYTALSMAATTPAVSSVAEGEGGVESSDPLGEGSVVVPAHVNGSAAIHPGDSNSADGANGPAPSLRLHHHQASDGAQSYAGISEASPMASPGPFHHSGSDKRLAARVRRWLQGGDRAQLARFTDAQTIGENALLSGRGGLRYTTCVATRPTVLMRVNRGLFDWFVSAYPRDVISFVLTTTARQWRVAYFTLVEYLHLPVAWRASMEGGRCAVDLEQYGADLRRLSAAVVEKYEGNELFQQGEASDCVYVVLQGRVRCTAAKGGLSGAAQVITREVGPGAIVGGLATFVGLPYRETTVCMERCLLATFPKRAFTAIADSNWPGTPGGSGTNLDLLAVISLAVARYVACRWL